MTSANPWPADVTAEEVASAQAALAAYAGYWQMVDSAVAKPTQDWAAAIAEYAAGPAERDMLDTLSQLTSRGRYASGYTMISPIVTKIEPGMVSITDCIDKSSADLLDLQGNSVRAPDVQGTYLRHPSDVQMTQLTDGRWVVAFSTDNWSITC